MAAGSASTQTRTAWTAQEDAILRDRVATIGAGAGLWPEVAKGLPGRTSKSCAERWQTHLNPAYVRSAEQEFSEWEIAVMMLAYQQHGSNWLRVSEYLPMRSPQNIKNQVNYFNTRPEQLRDNGLLKSGISLDDLLEQEPAVVEARRELLRDVLAKGQSALPAGALAAAYVAARMSPLAPIHSAGGGSASGRNHPYARPQAHLATAHPTRSNSDSQPASAGRGLSLSLPGPDANAGGYSSAQDSPQSRHAGKRRKQPSLVAHSLPASAARNSSRYASGPHALLGSGGSDSGLGSGAGTPTLCLYPTKLPGSNMVVMMPTVMVMPPGGSDDGSQALGQASDEELAAAAAAAAAAGYDSYEVAAAMAAAAAAAAAAASQQQGLAGLGSLASSQLGSHPGSRQAGPPKAMAWHDEAGACGQDASSDDDCEGTGDDTPLARNSGLAGSSRGAAAVLAGAGSPGGSDRSSNQAWGEAPGSSGSPNPGARHACSSSRLQACSMPDPADGHVKLRNASEAAAAGATPEAIAAATTLLEMAVRRLLEEQQFQQGPAVML